MTAATEKSTNWVDLMEDEGKGPGYRPFYPPASAEQDDSAENKGNERYDDDDGEKEEQRAFDNEHEEDYVYNEADGEWYYIGTDVSLDNFGDFDEHNDGFPHDDDDEENYVYNEADGGWYYVGPQPDESHENFNKTHSQQQKQKQTHKKKSGGRSKDDDQVDPKNFKVTVDVNRHTRKVKGRGAVKYGKEEMELGGGHEDDAERGDEQDEIRKSGDHTKSQRHHHQRGGQDKSRGRKKHGGKKHGKKSTKKNAHDDLLNVSDDNDDTNDGWGADATVITI